MRRAGGWTAMGLFALALLTGPRQADAQVLGTSDAPGGPELPRWLTAWSPLAAVADLHRSLPGTEVSLPSLLTLPAPRVGSFWSAGNPGALPFENSDTYAQIRTGYKRYSGEYRRPLDAGQSRTMTGCPACSTTRRYPARRLSATSPWRVVYHAKWR